MRDAYINRILHRDSNGNPFRSPPDPKRGTLFCTNIVSECDDQKKKIFHKNIFLLEFNERCLKQIALPLGNAQKGPL
ncbi:hypothetical protein FLBR109950_12315 [Flavobacterium branchiophilum]